MTKMGREMIRDLFSLLQLNLLSVINGKTFILQGRKKCPKPNVPRTCVE